jgi:CHRD domain
MHIFYFEWKSESDVQVSYISCNHKSLFTKSDLSIVMDRRNFVAITIIVATTLITSLAIISPSQYGTAQGQQQNASQFSANLTGDLTFPPTVTNATGTAEFTVVGDGNTMRYKIDANNIDKVNNVYVAASSGGRYVDLVQLRSGVNEGVTGPVNGTLVQGNFTASDFTGRLNVDQMSDLLKLIIDGNAFVRVQTTDEPLGKIVGKITPNLPP